MLAQTVRPVQSARMVDFPEWVELETSLRRTSPLLTAFSGGVDSTLLAVLAHRVHGDRALAVTVDMPAMARREIQEACALADAFGLRHLVFPVEGVLELRAFKAHPPDRCYHCKHMIFSRLLDLSRERGFRVVADGSNADDRQTYRPGLRALRELGIHSPLMECGMTKAMIRRASAVLGLPTADKPSAPCLATRIPFGIPVVLERIRRVEALEEALRAAGFVEFRVRLERDDAALAQVHREEMECLDFPARQAAALQRCRRVEPSVKVQFDPAGLQKGYYEPNSD